MASEVIQGNLVPVGFQTIAGAAAATALTVPALAVRGKALIQVEDQDVRWRDDGTSPTAAVGTLLQAGRQFFYEGDLSAIEFIEVAVATEINISYYQRNQ